MFEKAIYDTVYIEVNDAYTFQKETSFVSTAIFRYTHFCVFGLRMALVGVDTCTIYNKRVVVDFVSDRDILYSCVRTNSGNTML
jgi:hypothetical protein